MTTASQTEYARHRGVSKMSVSKWKARGLLVLTAEGLVDIEATDARIDSRPAVNRGGSATRMSETTAEAGKPNGKAVRAELPPSILDTTEAGQAMTLGLTHADAARVKEVALARRQMAAFDREQGKLVEIETVGRLVEQEYAVVRERLLAIPGKLAAKLVDRTRSEIEAALQEEITEALDELHDPDFAGRVESGEQAAESASLAEAAAAIEPGPMG